MDSDPETGKMDAIYVEKSHEQVIQVEILLLVFKQEFDTLKRSMMMNDSTNLGIPEELTKMK